MEPSHGLRLEIMQTEETVRQIPFELVLLDGRRHYQAGREPSDSHSVGAKDTARLHVVRHAPALGILRHQAVTSALHQQQERRAADRIAAATAQAEVLFCRVAELFAITAAKTTESLRLVVIPLRQELLLKPLRCHVIVFPRYEQPLRTASHPFYDQGRLLASDTNHAVNALVAITDSSRTTAKKRPCFFGHAAHVSMTVTNFSRYRSCLLVKMPNITPELAPASSSVFARQVSPAGVVVGECGCLDGSTSAGPS
eukprot:CAMPEP_0117605214 /NCGR_PEP_ID=MMETSP0784-20121206/79081_1 /TAXON_ID=39447 /ORGANISM="" /LENGTH=254 /DNA_ID=CAMNT_0005408257 /DNA_START=22 /DNA_END=787 /DNA_ORIENTATION=+